MTRRELIAVGCGVLILLTAEALLSDPRILFGRFLWFDELQIKLITAQSGVWHSITMIAHSGDETPPIYYLVARASWWMAALMGGNAESGFRSLAFLAVWVALLLTYAVLRRSFAELPALIAILTLWSCRLIVMCAFFARPYAILLASTAAFCLAYGIEEEIRAWSSLAIALCAMLVCGVHYFGIIALAAIVLGDATIRRESWRTWSTRLIPAAAGPILWILFLPIFRAQIAGYDVRTFLSPLTARYAIRVILDLWHVPIRLVPILLVVWGFSKLLAGEFGKSFTARGSTNLQPVAGMLGLVLVPLAILALSLKENHFVDRYMVTALLGLVPIISFLASRLSKRIQVVVIALVALLGASATQNLGVAWAHWQDEEEEMIEQCESMACDGLPIVSLTTHEAYTLYEYAPQLRDKIVFLDLQPTHASRLTGATINDGTCFRKWQTVVPDAPRVVTLDETP